MISPHLDLQSENDELRNKTSMPVEPSSNGATAEVWRKVSELQHENEWLKNKHRDEIQDLVTRMEEIEHRERIMPQPVAMTYETGTMPMSEQSSVSSSNFKKERAKAQRSAPLPPSSQSSCMKEEGEQEELAIKFKPKQTRAQRSVCCVYVKLLLRPFESRVRGGGGLGCSSEALPEAAAGVGPSSKGQ